MTIRELLNFSTFPGVNFHELERFKQNFRTSAFTCRIWSCRHAVFGFNNAKDLMLHEADHRKHICHFPGCSYPVFGSAGSLKGHIKEVHAQSNQAAPRKSIRKRVQPIVLSPSSQQDIHAEASRGGVPLTAKPRDYPPSWGFNQGQMTMKRRGNATFDGPRRLAKEDSMLSTDHEVRMKCSDGKSYVTDLDVQTLKRAEDLYLYDPTHEGEDARISNHPWVPNDHWIQQSFGP